MKCEEYQIHFSSRILTKLVLRSCFSSSAVMHWVGGSGMWRGRGQENRLDYGSNSVQPSSGKITVRHSHLLPSQCSRFYVLIPWLWTWLFDCLGQWDASRCDKNRDWRWACVMGLDLSCLCHKGMPWLACWSPGEDKTCGAEPTLMMAWWGRAPPTKPSLDQLSPSWSTDPGGHMSAALSPWVWGGFLYLIIVALALDGERPQIIHLLVDPGN